MLGPKRVKLPEVIHISSACYSINTKRMLDELKEKFDKSSCIASQWNIVDDPIGITDWVKNAVVAYTQGDVDATLTAWRYYNEIKKQQEETKMDAKKCDKCGKLYENTDRNNYPIRAFLCGRVTDYEKNTYAQEKIKEVNTYDISVVFKSGTKMDLCPECREKLKNFFESGNNETTVIKKAEE